MIPILFLLQLISSQITYLDNKLFQGIKSTLCFRVLNANGVYGCTSKGNTGILYRFDSEIEVENGVAVVPQDKFTKSLVETLRTKNVKGIVIYRTEAVNFDSIDDGWNTFGSNALLENFEFPIYEVESLDSDNSTIALKRALEFNEAQGYQGDLYQMEFRGLMEATQNTESCLRREQCDPIGEKSVWSTWGLGDKKTVVVATSFDSNSLFREDTLGNSRKLGAIAMLGVADALSKSPTQIQNLQKNLLFTFFGAESWDRAGSTRFVEDISNFACEIKEINENCPVNAGDGCSQPCRQNLEFEDIDLQSIESIIEIDSVGKLYESVGNRVSYFAHVNDLLNPTVQELLDAFPANSSFPGFNGTQSVNITFESNNLLPPNSASSFVKKKSDIGVLLISDYDSKFTNPYLNTNLDRGKMNVNQVAAFCGFIDVLSKAIYKIVDSTTAPPEVQVDCAKIKTFLDCSLDSYRNCKFLNDLFPDSKYSPQESSYSSVFTYSPAIKLFPFLLMTAMRQFTTTSTQGTCTGSNDCQVGFECLGKVCIKSITNTHPAVGIGFSHDVKSNSWKLVGEFGSWAESKWDASGIRISKKSGNSEIINLAVGVAVVLITGLALYLADKRQII